VTKYRIAMFSQLFYTRTVHSKPSGESNSNVAYTVDVKSLILSGCCETIDDVYIDFHNLTLLSFVMNNGTVLEFYRDF